MQDTPTTDIFMTAREVAEVLSIGTRTVWRLAARGAIPKPVKIGRMSRWPAAHIERYMQSLTSCTPEVPVPCSASSVAVATPPPTAAL